MLQGSIIAGYALFGSHMIPEGGIRVWFCSLWVSLMLSRLCLSCMGLGYTIGMIMHDVVVMLCYYTYMFMIIHVHDIME